MIWSEMYDESTRPTLENIKEFVNNKLCDELCLSLEKTYAVLPKIEYSKCSMQKGWNVKYKKRGKSLCTIYPMKGYFIALIVIGEKEEIETKLVMPTCSGYVQKLFKETPFSCGGRWLMIEVRELDTLQDALKLIQIRATPKKHSTVKFDFEEPVS
ncbi:MULTISPECIES: DUF3788 domain-containing protein [Clostridium]|uniref:DUF3788 domain-containing protein n=1 Tax=Clostridium sporogenes TaxID=1509 RepID=A0ABX4K6I4_CLOSG|nr:MULTISPECIES: DUF3788 domain-containing protein [Clostridium]KOY65317.1 hypothetical protein AN649_14335 [Clostridium sporogenes]MBW5456121.1 DUF3788 family protein [Clostridium sporogenes]MDS1009067.1 DUF3788 domain-containing protein [Clostridium sporogenes]MDU7253228.1 DUF3788 domain-containing protein [Clostridium sp.]NFF64017.1 DUF3788 domain-containing protein [Clostridium sporogenes]